MGLARGGFPRVEHQRRAAARVLDREPACATAGRSRPRALADGASAGGRSMSALFRATVEATEEAVVNALIAAHTVTGRDGNTLHALPVDRTLAALARSGRLGP